MNLQNGFLFIRTVLITLFLLTVSTLFAKTISGKIVNSKGVGLAGAIIQLQNEEGFATSGAEGFFTLTIESVAIVSSSQKMESNSAQKSLHLQASKDGQLGISIQTIQGRTVSTYNKNMNVGEHQLSAAELMPEKLASGMYIVTTSWNGLQYHHKVMCIGKGDAQFVETVPIIEESVKRSSAVRAIDTLEISLGGYFLEKVALDSYDDLDDSIILLRLGDKLSLQEAFEFEGKIFLREGNVNHDTLVYVGENFTTLSTVSHCGKDYTITWSAESNESGKSAVLSIAGGDATVTRGPLTESAKAFTLTASAVLNDTESKVLFDFKVLSKQFKVMTWNIWGKHGQDPELSYIYKGQSYSQRERLAMIMKDQDPDVLGLVETYGNRPFLMQELGYEHATYKEDSESYLGNLSVISRYPIANDIMFGSEHNHMGSEIKISDERQFILYSTWFTSSDMCQWMKVSTISDDEGIEWDKKGRLEAANRVMNNIKSNGYYDNADTKPVIVVGDHNTISHLDYIESTVGLPQNYGRGIIKNPISSLFADNGFSDSYREVKQDPIEYPALSHDPHSGFVESKVYTPSGWHIRIDFIYYKSDALVPVESVIVDRFLDGKTVTNNSDGKYAFPSDHAAFVSTFEWLD